jgi:hypothetical protein
VRVPVSTRLSNALFNSSNSDCFFAINSRFIKLDGANDNSESVHPIDIMFSVMVLKSFAFASAFSTRSHSSILSTNCIGVFFFTSIQK